MNNNKESMQNELTNFLRSLIEIVEVLTNCKKCDYAQHYAESHSQYKTYKNYMNVVEYVIQSRFKRYDVIIEDLLKAKVSYDTIRQLRCSTSYLLGLICTPRRSLLAVDRLLKYKRDDDGVSFDLQKISDPEDEIFMFVFLARLKFLVCDYMKTLRERNAAGDKQ